MDPGLIFRSIQIPGLISSSWGGSDNEPIWTANIDPPLQEGTTIALGLWRPLELVRGKKEDVNARRRLADLSVRKLPRIEPLQVERYTGILGVRRPSHWTGRIEPVVGVEPISDESFVKAWGPLPDDGLTLSGTTRLARGDLPQLQTGPSVARVKSRGKLDLRIEPGRIGVEYEAEVGDLGEPVHHFEIAVPPDLIVLKVDSPGLSDWSRKGPRQLVVRYDRVPLQSRQKLTISGWIPVVEDPLSTANPPRRIPMPWLDIPGMETVADTLSISSITPVELLEAQGLTLLSKTAPAATVSGNAVPRSVQTYRVDNPKRLGTLQWTPPPPEVNVQVENQMTVHPESAEWVAAVRYDVRGGPLDSIHLKLSTPWVSSNAQYELTGNTFHRRSDSIGPVTLWALRPDRPIWGSQRIVIRSALPLRPNQEVQQPEITPLGKGHAATYLSLVNATGTSITTAGSSGLQEIAPPNLFQTQEFVHLPGTETHVYRVGGDSVGSENWSLKAQIPLATDRAEGSPVESVRVLSADLTVTILGDRSLQGRAVYQTEERTGRFLVADLPSEAALLWSTVDQNPVAPLRSDDGRWLVPVVEQAGHRVCLFWSQPAGKSWTLILPRAGAERVPTLVTLCLPSNLAVDTSQDELDITTADRMELERADRIAVQIKDFMNQMDRRSGRDRQRVTTLLVAHELALRSAERSVRWSARQGLSSRRPRVDRSLEYIRTSREVVLEAVRANALDDEIETAQYSLGLTARAPVTTLGSPMEAGGPDRIRSLGEPTYLMGFTSSLSENPSRISLTQKAPGTVAPDAELRARLLLMLGLLVTLGLITLARSHLGAWNALILTALLGLLGFVGGPLIMATGAGIAAAGWLSRPRGTGLRSDKFAAGDVSFPPGTSLR